MYLLDTNICVELFGNNQRAVDRLASASQLDMYVSAITVGELAYGAMRSSRPTEGIQQIRRLMLRANVPPVDSRCAFEYGRLKSQLGAAGMLLEDSDLYIASTALSRGLILVTHD